LTYGGGIFIILSIHNFFKSIEEEIETFSPLTVVCDGLFSNTRRLPCNLKLVQHHQTNVDSWMGLGKISQDHGMCFHFDAAYAGSACIFPGYRHYLDGVELAN
jgi:hypothetical protein